jgi:hypothetical protein
MAKCSKCKSRKAKRHCPALRSDLCPLCCGVVRDKDVHCPPSCPFLTRHKPYQEKRIVEKKQPPPSKSGLPQDDLLRNERMAWLALHLEAPLMEYGQKVPSFTDADAVVALEYAKDKLEKGRSLIFVPGETHKPKNEIGEAVYTSMENCRYEQAVILAAGTDGYKTEEKVKCLDRVIFAVKTMARTNTQGRNYIEHLAEQFARLQEQSRSTKILTPR